MVPRLPYQNLWGWTTRPTPAFRWLFLTFLGVFLVQTIFQFAQSVPTTTFNQFFALSLPGIQHGYIWQLATYGFLHQDIMHFLVNSFLLYIVAYEVEYQIGLKNFLLLFMTGIFAGGILWLACEHLRSPYSATLLMGSSGGVFAMIFGFIAMFPERPIGLLAGLKAKFLGMILTAIAVYFIAFPSNNVAHMAHLGGIIAGIAYVKILMYHWRTPPPTALHRRPELVGHRTQRMISRTEFINTKVDPILEKIAQQGIESLTPEERKILDEAHDRLT